MSDPNTPAPNPPNTPPWWLSRRMLVVLALVPAAMLLGLLAWAVINPTEEVVSAGCVEGQKAPDFAVQGLQGDMVRLSDAQGKVVMVDFWASWCPSCREEASHLAELYEEYKARGVEFIGVAIWDYPEELLKYVEQFDLTYPNALDESGTVAIDYGVVATPEKCFIDRSGNMVSKFVGPTSPVVLRQQLDQLLEY